MLRGCLGLRESFQRGSFIGVNIRCEQPESEYESILAHVGRENSKPQSAFYIRRKHTVNVKPEASVTLRRTAVMDADTQGLASALASLGIYNVADLVEMARCGVLHEVWS